MKDSLKFYKTLMYIQVSTIGGWCMLEKDWLIMIHVLALLVTYNLYRYENKRKY